MHIINNQTKWREYAPIVKANFVHSAGEFCENGEILNFSFSIPWGIISPKIKTITTDRIIAPKGPTNLSKKIGN